MASRKKGKMKLTKKERKEMQAEVDRLLAEQAKAPGGPVAVKIKAKIPLTRKGPRISPRMPKLR